MSSTDNNIIKNQISDIEQIFRSTNRIDILSQLLHEGQLRRDELKETCDVSRTSLQRNLDTLVEQGWIQNSGTTYQLTPCGKFVTEEILSLIEVFDIATDLQEVLHWIPVSEIDLDLRPLADAEITIAEPGNPHAPVNQHIATLRTATICYALLPSVSQYELDVIREQIAAGAKQELVFSRQVVAELQTNPEFEAVIDEMAESTICEAYVYEGTFPFFLGILDESVQIGGEDTKGMPQALLETDQDEVREWAMNVYSDYKAEAIPISSTVNHHHVRKSGGQ